MLLALLYADDGVLAAAAPACDQQPYGDRFWTELHGVPVRFGPYHQTAYLRIDDDRLVERLLTMRFTDGQEAARAVDGRLGLT